MAHATPLSRRSLLAISAAASAGALVGSPGAATAASKALAENPDDYLLNLCTEWKSLRREFNMACAALDVAEEAAVDKHRALGMPALWAEVHADPAYNEADQWTRENVNRSHTLFEEIAQTRAVTLKGIMAKANVTLGECLKDGGIDEELEESDDGIVPGFMALSLVRDLLEVMERRGELNLMNGGQA